MCWQRTQQRSPAEGRGVVTEKSGASHRGALWCDTHTRSRPCCLSPQLASEDTGKMKINGVGKVISSESHSC